MTESLSNSQHPFQPQVILKYQGIKTYIRNRSIWQLSIPLILNLLYLPFAIKVNGDNTANNLLLPNPLNHISCFQVHQYRVSRILHTMMLSLNRTERALQSIPLRLILLAALSDGDRIFKGCVVAPESELLQRWTASKEVKNRADNGLLLGGEGNAGGGVDVGIFDFEVRGTWLVWNTY